MLAIGIDIGTTTLCAVVSDSATGKIVDSITVVNDSFIEGKRFERIQNVEVIIKSAMALVEQLTQKYEIGCIGVTGQMHGIVYVDGSGNAVSPLYTWQDRRGDELFKDGKTYAQILSEITKSRIASGFGSVTHFYNCQMGVLPKKAEVFCTIHDYLAMKLARRTQPLIHPSDAASFGGYDLENDKYLTYRLEDTYFPAIERSAKIIGETVSGIPVAVAIGDNQASFIGSVKEPQNSLLLNVGTGSQISILSNRILETEIIETRPYNAGWFLNVGASLCGGRAYALFKNFFYEITKQADGASFEDLYQILDRLSEAAYDRGQMVLVDTRFGGTRHDPSIRGSISSIGVDNFTPGAFAAGIQVGIVEELYVMYQMIGPGEKPLSLVGAGNGIRKNRLLQKIFAKRFELPLFIPEFKEEAAFGASLFAMVGTGEFKDLAQAQKIINLIKVETE